MNITNLMFNISLIDYIPYILLILFIIVFFVVAYIRIKFGFWAIQPVFHVYDIGYMFFPPGIINHDLPIENRYCNFKNIETINYAKVTDIQMNKFIQFIQTHYLQNKDNVFNPKKNNIEPYFSQHHAMSIYSFYKEPINMIDAKNDSIIETEKVVGVMTTRPINVQINNGDKDAKFVAYYVDYLCVDKMYRKMGIAPQIIQTHHYHQRRMNKNVVVSLFKREGQLTGIVPLCVYSTYGFSVYKWRKPHDLHPLYKLLEITPQNFHLIVDFIKINLDKFDIIINFNMPNIIELIKTKNIFIYSIFCENEVKSLYFFRKSCVFVEKDMEILTCFASINSCDDNELFVDGFKLSFWTIAEKHYFGFAAIENISHNNVIIQNLLIRNHPKIVSPTAYFFYNFAYPTFKPEKVLIIN